MPRLGSEPVLMVSQTRRGMARLYALEFGFHQCISPIPISSSRLPSKSLPDIGAFFQ